MSYDPRVEEENARAYATNRLEALTANEIAELAIAQGVFEYDEELLESVRDVVEANLIEEYFTGVKSD